MKAVMARTLGFGGSGVFSSTRARERTGSARRRTAPERIKRGCRLIFMVSREGGNAGDFFSDDEIVDVAHDAVVVDDAVGAEDVAGFASGFECDGDVVHFEHGDVCRVSFAFIFQAADVEG